MGLKHISTFSVLKTDEEPESVFGPSEDSDSQMIDNEMIITTSKLGAGVANFSSKV